MDSQHMTVEQKFAKAMVVLQQIRPFYSAVYEVMEKIECSSIDTIGVTTNKLYYNKEFVDSTEFSNFLFVILHEVGHIALMHVARMEGRNLELWNIAADLYVNAMLNREFKLSGPGSVSTVMNHKITFLNGALWNNTIDVDVDYTEMIYEVVCEQAKKNGYFNDSLSKGDYTFSYKGHGSDGGREQTEFTVSRDKFKADLIDTGADQCEKDQEARKIVSDAVVRSEMNGNSAGDSTDGLMRLSKNMLKSELDWKKLLRRYLVKATASDSSFSNPDKRMYYASAIYPGQIADEMNEIHGIKVCIDTSGSINDDDIKYFCGQVYSLVKQFKIRAELIYWDSEVQSTGEFTGYKEFERIDCMGFGGTKPQVVFEYLSSKKCKVKPVVTLMFTDGYYYEGWDTLEMRKKYKDTIWIMTKDYNKEFKEPFGKKAIAKFN